MTTEERITSLADNIGRQVGVPDPETARQGGRGGIKWSLRERLANGEWSDYVHSSDHQIKDGSMTLRLKNESSGADSGYSEVPQPRCKKQFTADRMWRENRREIEQAWPILSKVDAQNLKLVQACRRALIHEQILARQLENKRQQNPDFAKSKTYERTLRNWKKAQEKSKLKLQQVEAVAGS